MSIIHAVGTAVPDLCVSQSEALDVLEKRYADELTPRTRQIMRRVFRHPGVRCRHLAFEGWGEARRIGEEDPDARVGRFTKWAVRLSADAAREAMAEAGVAPRDIQGIVVNTCTGYICPGLSTYLIEELDLQSGTQFHDLVGSGCAGAIPALQVADGVAGHAREQPVLCVSAEICSATFEMSDDMGLIISNVLFADGAGACIVRHGGRGLRMVDAVSHCDPSLREHVRYVHRNGRLHNQLSTDLPELAADAVDRTLRSLLQRNDLSLSDVRHWALHPGGPKVIDALRDRTGIPEEHMRVARETLAAYGNMSSATVWFALRRILDGGLQRGEWCVMAAFGAGFSVHAQLLRQET